MKRITPAHDWSPSDANTTSHTNDHLRLTDFRPVALVQETPCHKGSGFIKSLAIWPIEGSRINLCAADICHNDRDLVCHDNIRALNYAEGVVFKV
eukprot:1368756-Amphidinium_carterae.2